MNPSLERFSLLDIRLRIPRPLRPFAGSLARSLVASLAALFLAAPLVAADPEILLEHEDGSPAWIVGELGWVELPSLPFDGSDAYHEELYTTLMPAMSDLVAEYLGGTGDEDLELYSMRLGAREIAHFTFQQTFSGQPVVDSYFRVRVDLADGQILSVNGRFFPFREDYDLEGVEILPFSEALLQVLAELEEESGELAAEEALVFWPSAEGLRLAYEAAVQMDEFGPEVLLIDAFDGSVLTRRPRYVEAVPPSAPSSSSSTPYGTQQVFRTLEWGAGIATICEHTVKFPMPGFLTVPVPCSPDDQAARAHEYTMTVYQFYKTQLGWSDWHLGPLGAEFIGDASRLANNVRAYGLEPGGTPIFRNVAYYHFGFRTFNYGPGDGVNYYPFSYGFDVVAHEVTHRVTQTLIGNPGSHEWGAVVESFSDIFAAAAEHWNGASQTDVWLLGEDIAMPGAAQDIADRFMSDPTKDGESVDHYDDLLHVGESCGTWNDSCGVHTNSGIGNLAFYLLAEGGQHPSLVTSPIIQGLGMETALAIFWEALNTIAHPIHYASLRVATEQAAQELYDPETAAVVSQVWDVLGVP